MRAASFASFDDSPTLDFGKYRGQPLTEVETSYLEWVKTADRCSPALRTAIDTELATRTPKKPEIQDRHRAPQGVPKDVIDIARMIVTLGMEQVAAALGQDYRVGVAEALLKFSLDMTELESDPGTLPF